MTIFKVIDTVDSFGNPDTLIQKIEDDGTIWAVPKDPANSDYQRYLNPEAEQSTPNLAD
jgi:type II secretory pathway component HofQ